MSYGKYVTSKTKIMYMMPIGVTTMGSLLSRIIARTNCNISINGLKLCLKGDEHSLAPGVYPATRPMPYTTSTHTIPGVGYYQLKPLRNKNLSNNCFFTNKKIITNDGGVIKASFIVLSPAMIPGSPPVPDPKKMYRCKAKFLGGQTDIYEI